MSQRPSSNPRRDKVVFGGILILLGFTLYYGDGLAISRVWPWFVLIAGLAHLAVPDAGEDGRKTFRGAAWLLFVAAWGFVNVYHVFRLSYATSWPLLLIGGGATIVWASLESPCLKRREGRPAADSERAS